MDRAGDADPARLRHALETRRDVDAVAEQIVATHNDVAEVDADPKVHAPRLGQVGIAALDLLLDRARAAHRLDRARELGHHTVAGSGEDPPMMPGDQFIDHLAARVQRSQRPFLVARHEARIAGHVGREDGRELADDVCVLHIQPRKAYLRLRCPWQGSFCSPGRVAPLKVVSGSLYTNQWLSSQSCAASGWTMAGTGVSRQKGAG